MIARLKGVLAVKSPEGLLIDVHGVGFRVLVSLNAFGQLPEQGQPVEIPIHTHMRESSLDLFGFADLGEKALFTQLLAVSGVGPRMALTILSGMPTDDLITALAEGNVRRLVGIPGIGKRTAERLIVDLQDKVRAIAGSNATRTAAEAGPAAEAVSALVNLGYRLAESEEAVRRAMGAGGAANSGNADAGDLAAIIREALKTVSA